VVFLGAHSFNSSLIGPLTTCSGPAPSGPDNLTCERYFYSYLRDRDCFDLVTFVRECRSQATSAYKQERRVSRFLEGLLVEMIAEAVVMSPTLGRLIQRLTGPKPEDAKNHLTASSRYLRGVIAD